MTHRERTDDVATITVAAHKFVVGDEIAVASVTDNTYNLETALVSAVTATTVSYPNEGDNEAKTADVAGSIVGKAGGAYVTATATVTAVDATTFSYANTGADEAKLAATDATIAAVAQPYRLYKADATAATKLPAVGYVVADTALGAYANVHFNDVNRNLAELVPGTLYFLSETAGGVTATAPSGSGKLKQALGVALSATELQFERDAAVTL